MEPADRQEQIVRVAATHLSRDGAAGVSMSSIAKDAGVTRALIYRYFPGKQALLDAVLRHESERLLAATEPDPKLSARDNLHRSLNAYLDFFSASSGGVRELYTASANPVARELVEANHELQATRILQVLELDDTPRHRLAAGGRPGRGGGPRRPPGAGAPPRGGAGVDLCITALVALLGQDLA
jgi:transcriptional regulator